MSKIDKLSILGIRSFDNTRSESITFFSPLTLVVGTNGSGKTTIIECLKYATTGLQPPNSKGGAFIHDPKLAAEREVMAQVKLLFNSTSGARMVATRSIQLSVKKAARSMKTLECNLLIDRNGEKTSVSSRTAELDQILPQYLGVSKAVLDNVIFCHQDESLWPMSEPLTLKKKFDEIFEALKYTKAIDNIKQLRKKQNEELAKFKIMEQHAREDKDKAVKTEKRSRQLHAEIETIRKETEDLLTRMKHTSELVDKADRESESYSKILGALEGKKIEVKGKQQTIDDLLVHLKEVPESDEWLATTLEQFESRLSQYERQQQAKKEEYLEKKELLDTLRRQLNQKLADQGKHEQDKEAHERQLERRKAMIHDAASKHNIRGYDDMTDDAQAEDFMFKIRKVSKDHNVAFERSRREAESDKKAAQVHVNQLTTRKAALQESKVSAKKQMALNDREANEHQRNVNKIAADEGSKAVIETRIEDLSGRIQKAKVAATKSKWEHGIAEANTQLRSYEDDSSRLNNDLIQGTKKAGDMARLAHLKQELKENQRSLKTMTGAHGDKIRAVVGDEWYPATLERSYQAASEERARELQAAERDRDTVARELEQVQYKHRTLRDDIKEKTKELKHSEEAVRGTIDDDPAEYPTALQDMQSRLDAQKEEINSSGGLGDYMEKILDAATSDKPCCRVCTRSFKEGAELERFKKRIEGLVKKTKISAESTDIAEMEGEVQKARNAGILYETWKKLTQEIPTLKSDLEQMVSKRDALLAKIEEHDKVVEKRQQSKKELDMLSRTVATIVKCDADVKSYEAQIEELAEKQAQSGSSRTLEDIQEQISGLNEKIRNSKQTVTRLTNERDQSRDELSRMELELKDMNAELSAAAFQLEKKAALVARVDEYKALNVKQRETIDKADKDIERLEPEISTAQAKYDDLVQRAETKEQELQREASELNKSVDSLNLLNEQIKSYIDRAGPNQLSRTKRDIKNLEQEIGRVVTDQENITRDANKITQQLGDSENTRRQYADNLRYRRESRALEQLNAEIRELAAHNAEVDVHRLQQEASKRRQEHTRLHAEHAARWVR